MNYYQDNIWNAWPQSTFTDTLIFFQNGCRLVSLVEFHRRCYHRLYWTLVGVIPLFTYVGMHRNVICDIHSRVQNDVYPDRHCSSWCRPTPWRNNNRTIEHLCTKAKFLYNIPVTHNHSHKSLTQAMLRPTMTSTQSRPTSMSSLVLARGRTTLFQISMVNIVLALKTQVKYFRRVCLNANNEKTARHSVFWIAIVNGTCILRMHNSFCRPTYIRSPWYIRTVVECRLYIAFHDIFKQVSINRIICLVRILIM